MEMTEPTIEQYRAAIRSRHSVRAYREEPLSAEVVSALRAKIDELNGEGRLHMQLVLEEPKAFRGVFAYGKFRGVRNYVVVSGMKVDDLDERVGYYGERLVLFAQTLGLNSCWVGLSYTKVPGTYSLADGEKICCYIALGYGETPGCDHKRKTPAQVSNAGPDTPEWFLRGVEAALLAPTAINQQKFSFEYVPDEEPGVRARRGFSLVGYTQMDLGIARLHFEIGAYPARFRWL